MTVDFGQRRAYVFPKSMEEYTPSLFEGYE
jgi:hypothetical protein